MNQPSRTPGTTALPPAAGTAGASSRPAAEGVLAVIEAAVLAGGYDQAPGGKPAADTPQHEPDGTPTSDGTPPTGRHGPRNGDLGQAITQRLFAVGLDLHTVLGLTAHPHATRRLHHAIHELDSTIKEIRILLVDPRFGEVISEIAEPRPPGRRPPGRRPTPPAIEPGAPPAAHDAIIAADIMRP
jgi:hypothetical protein